MNNKLNFTYSKKLAIIPGILSDYNAIRYKLKDK